MRFGGQPVALAGATLLLAAIAQRYTFRLAPGVNVARARRITLGVAYGLPMTTSCALSV